MKRIWVVDDEELLQFTICEMLKSEGYDVDSAEDGLMAIEMQRTEPYDLILTDLIMPDKEGLELLIDLKSIYPDIKVIATSGGGRMKNLDFLAMAKDFGAQEILAKPFSSEQLLSTVKKVLDA